MKKLNKNIFFYIGIPIIISLVFTLYLVFFTNDKIEFDPEIEVCLKTNNGKLIISLFNDTEIHFCDIDSKFGGYTNCEEFIGQMSNRKTWCIAKVLKSVCFNSSNDKECVCSDREIELSTGDRTSDINRFYEDCSKRLNVTQSKIQISSDFFFSETLDEIRESCSEITNESGWINGYWYSSYCSNKKIKTIDKYDCRELLKFLLLENPIKILDVEYTKEEIYPYFEEECNINKIQ